MIEFLKDQIERDPAQAYPQHEFYEGKSIIKSGDAVVDAWNKDIANGKIPDFLAALDSEDRAKLAKFTHKEKNQDDLQVFHDTYAKEKS